MWPFKPKIHLTSQETIFLLRKVEEEIINSAPASIFNPDIFEQQQQLFNLCYKLHQHQLKLIEKVYM